MAESRMRTLVTVDQPLVLISQMPRSGGTLLLRLVDGHPACHVYPFEMGKFLFTDPRSPSVPRAWKSVLDRKLLQMLGEHGQRQSKDGLNEDRDQHPLLIPPRIRRALLKELMERASNPTQRQMLDCYATAFFNAWLDNRNLHTQEPKRWAVAFAPGAMSKEGRKNKFGALYPDGRGITLVRDPWSWFVSARRWSPRWSDRNAAIEGWIDATRRARQWKKDSPDAVAVVAFDRLVRYTRATMREVSCFLEIELHPSLTAPTINGLPAKANSSFVAKGYDISRDPLSRRNDLSREDAAWIDERAGALYRDVRGMALPARHSRSQ